MPSLRDIISCATAGDPKSVELLLEHFGHVIGEECSRYGVTGNPDLSHSDLFQEVATRVWMKLGQFRGCLDGDGMAIVFESWLRKTARTVLSNYLRDRNARKRSPEVGITYLDESQELMHEGSCATPSSILIRDEQIKRVRLAIDEVLDCVSRQILELRIIDELPLSEIAKRMSMTYDQVRYSIQSSMNALEKRLSSP